MIGIVLGPEAELNVLEVRPETTPDYIHSKSFHRLLRMASPQGRRLLSAFEFGRSFGQRQPRKKCFDEGDAWRCREAYVILSPDECAELSLELERILNSPSFVESEFEERKFVGPLAKSLEAAAKQRRGMFLHAPG